MSQPKQPLPLLTNAIGNLNAMVFSHPKGGWVLPGCRITHSKKEAQRVAGRMSRLVEDNGGIEATLPENRTPLIQEQ